MCYDYRMITIFHKLTRCDLNAKEQEQKKGNKEQRQNHIVCKSSSMNHHAHVIFYEISSMSNHALIIAYAVHKSSSAFPSFSSSSLLVIIHASSSVCLPTSFSSSSSSFFSSSYSSSFKCAAINCLHKNALH